MNLLFFTHFLKLLISSEMVCVILCFTIYCALFGLNFNKFSKKQRQLVFLILLAIVPAGRLVRTYEF